MARRRAPAGTACLYTLMCAGAACYLGGLISARCHQAAWTIAALTAAVVLLGGVAGVLVAGYWVWRRRARQLVRDLEAWMREEARRDGGRRRG